MRIALVNGHIVCPEGVIENGSLIIDDGIIESVVKGSFVSGCQEVIDAGGAWIMPGFIDLHNDSIEPEAEPRPGAHIPFEVAMSSLESKLISHGITSIYHSFSCITGKREIRELHNIITNIESVNRLRQRALIRHYVHARYDITETKFALPLEAFIREEKVQFLSFMDHTPGQGQYRDIEVLINYLVKHENMSRNKAIQIVDERRNRGDDPSILIHMKQLIKAAAEFGLPVASHDDDSPDKVDFMKEMGVFISEFPINRESAAAAKSRGMSVVCGAPNVLRGGSNSGNMKVLDAIRDGSVDILCSDYLPGAMLHSVFKLFRDNEVPLHQAVRMVSLNPARATGNDSILGSVEEGKLADIIVVHEENNFPFVRHAFVNGVNVLNRERIQFETHADVNEKVGI